MRDVEPLSVTVEGRPKVVPGEFRDRLGCRRVVRPALHARPPRTYIRTYVLNSELRVEAFDPFVKVTTAGKSTSSKTLTHVTPGNTVELTSQFRTLVRI